MEERLQKILSSCGITSRRTAEEWILGGRVTVNGSVARLGEKADLDLDEICVDGTPVSRRGERTYLMLNKPRGYVTTLSDEKGRKTVEELVSTCGARVWPVGRLDYDSEGLLFLTDDGEMTQRLTHPSYQTEKEYLVWVVGNVEKAVALLSRPMDLDGAHVAAARVRRGHSSGAVVQLSITICQGINRQVRRMCGQAGLSVLRLKRIREGEISLDRGLAPGTWRHLTEEEIQKLKMKEVFAG